MYFGMCKVQYKIILVVCYLHLETRFTYGRMLLSLRFGCLINAMTMHTSPGDAIRCMIIVSF